MDRLRYLVMVAICLLCCAGCGKLFPSSPKMRASTPSPSVSQPAAAPAETPDPVVEMPIPPVESPAPAEPPASVPAEVAPEPPPEATAAASGELLFDNFADAEGAMIWTRNGAKTFEGPASLRTIYFFNGMPEEGSLVMRIVEDNVVQGPDGEPGVLAFSWQELPAKLPYSGFTYLGHRDQRLPLPQLQAATSIEDLQKIRLQFRHQAYHEPSDMPASLFMNCRIEPLKPDSFAKRLDLGTFTAEGEWGTFEMSLGEGTNAEAFLRAIADEKPTAFKIVWAQGGPVAKYQAGDTLRIDDIKLTSSPAE